jgi:putative FmdB family regulatory protein
MPTYDYRCDNCGHELEAFQSITAKPLRKCPDCGKLKLKRLLGTGAGLIFKGSGFYETDYRSDSYKKGAESEKPKSDTKKETKPETKKADTKATPKTASKEGK